MNQGWEKFDEQKLTNANAFISIVISIAMLTAHATLF